MDSRSAVDEDDMVEDRGQIIISDIKPLEVSLTWCRANVVKLMWQVTLRCTSLPPHSYYQNAFFPAGVLSRYLQ
jgi:hypothetical protein